jgi:hypothetical protein
MRRQEILERLGWTFVRIRGGEFFRHPDRAMEPVFEKLAELEITPTMGVSAPQPEDMRLRDEVIRRATEYRREWSKSAEVPLPRSDQEADEHASQPSRRKIANSQSSHVEAPTLPSGNGSPTPQQESLRLACNGLTAEEVRTQLVQLREERIWRDFPKADPKRGLLRDQMITVLLEDVPVTEKEWAERLPSWMRKETDQAQIKKYLPEVLRILAGMHRKN